MAEPLAGRLATCSYRAYRPEFGAPVRITRGPARWFPYPVVSVMTLAPTGAEFQHRGTDLFRTMYLARLQRIGLEYIGNLLVRAVPEGPICLLCFEDLSSVPPEGRQAVCHRRIWASWWEAETGDNVPELP